MATTVASVAVSVCNPPEKAEAYDTAAEQCYGLNRPELLAERWKMFSKLETFYKAFVDPGIGDALRDEIRDMLRSMMQDDAPFAGMCRYFVRQVWHVPL